MKQSLFYPCSGHDIRESVKSWLHLIDDFWFAEIKFCSHWKLKTGENETRWSLPNFRIQNLELVSQVETTLAGSNEQISPVKTHTYIHKKLNKTITVNFVGGCAVNAFNCLPVDKLAVLVNRGDHRVDGEGSRFATAHQTDLATFCKPFPRQKLTTRTSFVDEPRL